jgi:hypothetical protein
MPVGGGIAVHIIATFASLFHVGGYESSLSKVCHKCVTEVHKRFICIYDKSQMNLQGLYCKASSVKLTFM